MSRRTGVRNEQRQSEGAARIADGSTLASKEKWSTNGIKKRMQSESTDGIKLMRNEPMVGAKSMQSEITDTVKLNESTDRVKLMQNMSTNETK